VPQPELEERELAGTVEIAMIDCTKRAEINVMSITT
jgi:hypothetical protein